MSYIDPYLSVIGKKAIAWEQAAEVGDREQLLKMRVDFDEFRRSLPAQISLQSQDILEYYDSLLPRFPQYRP
ncbi:MAG: hypothetical protein P4M12_03870 [Gammaproteobacteria bacterium]|nr:hypothetical protein [Gammaproteobacteria bacterium]